MIDDIVFDYNVFILELPNGTPGGNVVSYSMDGFFYDFVSSGTGNTETSYVFIS